MRIRSSLAWLVTLAITGCGDDGTPASPDGPPEPPPPRIIAGGGIGDGPIQGVANLYVIDDATRDPIPGATVRVGDVEGTTDATGLFVAEGVTGPQTVVVKAADHRSEMWIGANGANMTLSLQLDATPNPRSATMTGSLSLASLPALAANHVYFAQVSYSASDDVGDAENQIPTANETDRCLFTSRDTPCSFRIVTRTGSVALGAAVLDVDTKGTTTLADDAVTQVAFAVHPAATIAANATMPGMDLTLVTGDNLADLAIDLGTPPSGLAERAAVVQLELPERTVLSLGVITTGTATLRAPKVAAVASATAYRLVGLARTGGTAATESLVLRRHLQGSVLTAGPWLPAFSSTSATRTGASWTAIAGATVHGVEYTQGTAKLLNVTAFDQTTSFTIPDLVALPGGPLTAKVTAIGATGLDVTNFSLDADRDKLDQVSTQTIDLP